MNKEIKWNVIPIIGLEDGDFNKYTVKQLNAIENGRSVIYLTDEEKSIINQNKSIAHRGLKETDETKLKKSLALKNKPKSSDHRKKLSESKKGKKVKPELIEKYKVIFSGEGNPMYGKSHSEETRILISKNHSSKQYIKCPHCDKEIGANNYKRYHGDNCKQK